MLTAVPPPAGSQLAGGKIRCQLMPVGCAEDPQLVVRGRGKRLSLHSAIDYSGSSEMRCFYDAPFCASRLSGVDPLLVSGGELVVVVEASLESRYEGWLCIEAVGGLGESNLGLGSAVA